ncbi:unnamed protein product [Chrysoparadoxa australica]
MSLLVKHIKARVAASGLTPQSGGRNIIAFSGGVDSSLVAAVVNKVYPSNSTACIGRSAALPQAQLEMARHIASSIGIEIKEIDTDEGTNEQYVANEGKSCFHCKTHLYTALEAVAETATSADIYVTMAMTSMSLSALNDLVPALTHPMFNIVAGPSSSRVMLFNGTNRDDRADTSRVGLKAAHNFGVASPIDHLTKDEVRAAAKELGLPNWNHAASPCLRSRLAFGVRATPQRLHEVEQAELIVKEELQLHAEHNLRVRSMAGNKALVEVDAAVVAAAMASIETLKARIIPLGFQALSVRQFRSGALSGHATAAMVQQHEASVADQ